VKNSQWLLLVLVSLNAHASGTYRLDSTNTQVSFTVQYLGIQWVSARFADINGEFVLDETGPASRVNVTVAIASLECNEPHWNERLRSPEWLDARRFPQMTYHSNSIRFGEQHAVSNGDLTLHGMTRPIVLEFSLQNCARNCRFSAHGRIRRSDFGLPHGFWSGGDQVDIVITGTIGADVRRAAARDRFDQN
jgi:polyisoprenoid-binding protein YceI